MRRWLRRLVPGKKKMGLTYDVIGSGNGWNAWNGRQNVLLVLCRVQVGGEDMERPAPLTYVPLFPRANHLAARAIQGWALSTQHENEGVGYDNAQYPVHSAPPPYIPWTACKLRIGTRRGPWGWVEFSSARGGAQGWLPMTEATIVPLPTSTLRWLGDRPLLALV